MPPSPGVITGPTSFGSGMLTGASSGSGDPVGFAGLAAILIVPVGYVSDSALSDTATYTNQTFSSLGVTPGVYEWLWGSGASQKFTLDAVPEPSSLLLFAPPLGIIMLVAARTRRREPGAVAAVWKSRASAPADVVPPTTRLSH